MATETSYWQFCCPKGFEQQPKKKKRWPKLKKKKHNDYGDKKSWSQVNELWFEKMSLGK